MLEIAVVSAVAILAAIAGYLIGRRKSWPAGEPRDPPRGLFRKIARLEEEQRRTQTIIERMNEGVVVVNASLTPVIANAAARRLLTLPGGDLPPHIPSDEVLSTARRALVERAVIESDLNWEAAGLKLRVRAAPIDDPEGVVLFLQDVTEEVRTQQLRRQFVAHASHELKTPVASLTALVDAIEQSLDIDAQATRRFAGRLSQETQRLGALIDDLMDLSRVEDPAALRARSVDLSEIARLQIDEIAAIARQKEIDVSSDVRDGVYVHGDEQHLELMIRNLLDNAVRYTGDGGRVSLSLQVADGYAHLDVADDGIGIPLAAQARVFERFFRVDEDRARASGGTGLGLSIVKNVAEAVGGSVSVTSELDEGSTFHVMLPLANPPAAT